MLAEGNIGARYVFCNSDGGALRRRNVRRRSFVSILKRAGVPAIRFHDLRHTSATLLLAGGVHPKVVQERLGHSQIGVTLDTYSHVLEGMDAAAAESLNGVFAPNGCKMVANAGG
jgi:integrase